MDVERPWKSYSDGRLQVIIRTAKMQIEAHKNYLKIAKSELMARISPVGGASMVGRLDMATIENGDIPPILRHV